MNGERGRVVEVLVTVGVVLVLIRVVVETLSGVLWDLPLALVPVLFMWAPVWVLRARGVDPDRYPLAIPAFSDREAWISGLRMAGAVILVVMPLFLVGYHLWQTALFPAALREVCDLGLRDACRLARVVSKLKPEWRVPSELPKLVAYHLFFVAIPEELFYRGYVQSRLDEVWAPRWRVLGADMGPGALVTCVVFALGHSVVTFQWWHAFIVFPSLLFAWLRARTGGVVAGAFFHAWANVTVAVLDVVYGLQAP